MIFERHTYTTREEWLKARGKGIGGSDSSSVVGYNPYKTNLQLWQEKMGFVEPEDISNKKAVEYGSEAEDFIRGIFRLDYRGLFDVYHKNNETLVRIDKPYLRASLDGEITVLEDLEVRSYWKKYHNKSDSDKLNIVPPKIKLEKGWKGVLEIKTTEILSSMHKEKWHNEIPQNYYCQCLHNLFVSGYDFVWLRSQLKFKDANDIVTLETRDYCFTKDSVLPDLAYLEREEDKYWNDYILNGKEPPLLIRF